MRPLRVVTANLDFALSPDVVRKDLSNITDDADIILFQEGKRVNVDKLILNPIWKVFQRLNSDARQGTGVAWRKSRVKAGRKRGLTLGTKPHGRAILTRYLAWMKVYVRDETGEEHPLIVVSAHLPPKRFWGLIYNIMLANIIRFVLSRKNPVLVGADWNKLVHHADDLAKMERRTGGKMYGYGIDGFLLVSKGKWKVSGIKRLPKNSPHGHHPVQIRLLPR